MRPFFPSVLAALLLSACAHPCIHTYIPNESPTQRTERLTVEATSGDTCSANSLGLQFENAKDCKSALKWFRKGAASTNPIPLFNLARIYEEGVCVPQDKQEAIRWYKKAAKTNYAPAMSRIGALYLTGEAPLADPAAARLWYEKAFAAGDPDAELPLAWIYMSAVGGPPEYEKALEISEPSLKKRNPAALHIAGLLYSNGLGTKRDLVKGYQYLLMSANAGNEEAKAPLEQIGLLMTNPEIAKASAQALEDK